MTNTLHRKGSLEALRGDFVVFTIPTRSISPQLPEKLLRFTEICLNHKPVNMSKIGDMALRRIDPRRIEEEMKGQLGITAAFDNLEAVASVIAELKKSDLGLPVNVSGLLEEVDACCKKTGLERHSVEQSLGIFGSKERLPPREIVEINSMCGHGLVSFNLINKVMEEVKLDRMTAEQGAYLLAKPCECGVFNPTRARQLLEKLRMK